MPKEEHPPRPECWRKHPNKPHSARYCYSQKPEIYPRWHSLHDQQEEWKGHKMLWKKRDPPRHWESTHIQKLHLPMDKLALKPKVAPRLLGPTSDPLKWKRLQELTQSLKSPREDEQHYAAQALGCLGISDEFIMEALQEVAKTGPEKVKFEACRSLALLGCLNKYVIQVLIHQMKGRNEARRMETLVGLRTALSNWIAVPKDKRPQVGDEGKLVPLLQTLMETLSNDAALEAALCLGFLRPCNKVVQEFLLQCLSQGPKSQQIKALRMLVKVMKVHTATVIKAILEQLCSSSSLEHRLEATKMLMIIGLEKLQAQGMEALTFDMLRKKMYNEPFLAMREAVAETVKQLKMKPMMMSFVETQLMNSSVTARREAVISLGVLGIQSHEVYHLLLNMLDAEKSQDLKKTLQETLILLASTDPWVQNKLKNKVLFVREAPETTLKPQLTRFQKEPERPEELTIKDFKLAKLSPLLVAKPSVKMDQQEKLTALTGSVLHPTISSDLHAAIAFSPCFSKPPKDTSQAKKLWEPRIQEPSPDLCYNLQIHQLPP